MAGLTAKALIAATCAASLTLTGCTWRWETEPVPTPTADAVTAARDDAARAEQRVLEALESSSSGNPMLRSYAATAATTHLEVLGGVYVPYPLATATTSPEPALPLLDAVKQAAQSALDKAFADSTSDAALLYGSMALGWSLAVWLEGEPEAVVGEYALPGVYGSSDLTPATTNLDARTIADLAIAHDQARFLYEVVAARETETARADALARARIHADRSLALTTIAGIDERQPIYQLPDALVASAESRRDATRDAEQALGWTYMTLTSGVGSDDRAWLMSAAFDAYASSALIEGFSIDEIPVLPGIVVDES